MNTLALLIQHSRWPPALAEGAHDAAFRAVNGCRDFVQVTACYQIGRRAVTVMCDLNGLLEDL